jgi:putative sigma-54 modulation protein
MRIGITATRLVLTPSLKSYIGEKIGVVEKILGRLEKGGELELFFEIARTTRHHRHGEVFYAEATLDLPGKTIRIEEYDEDAHIAIDRVKDRLKLDIKKYKEKRGEKALRRARVSRV